MIGLKIAQISNMPDEIFRSTMYQPMWVEMWSSCEASLSQISKFMYMTTVKLIWVQSYDTELEVRRSEWILLMYSDDTFHSWVVIFIQNAQSWSTTLIFFLGLTGTTCFYSQ